MFDDVCYKTSFLTHVVVRIDFVAPFTAFDKNIPPTILKSILNRFPIAEPQDSISQRIEVSQAGVKQEERHGKQWNFFGKEREKQLTIQPGDCSITYSKYSRFEDLTDEFRVAVAAIDEAAKDTFAKRFGLRYINQFEFDELNLATLKSYIQEELLGTLPFKAYTRNLTRNFHIVELKFDDIDVRFQYGFPNNDFPAVIRRPIFVIDIDAYSATVHTVGESVGCVKTAHEHIQRLFEESITDELRRKLNG